MRLKNFSLKLFVDLVVKVVVSCGVRGFERSQMRRRICTNARRDSGEVA
jgi:hypothetical protein